MDKLKVEIVIPDWVNWMAVDKNGKLYGYASKPSRGTGMWVDGESFVGLTQGVPPKNWKDELYTWS